MPPHGLLGALIVLTLLAYTPVRQATFAYEDETYLRPATAPLTASAVLRPRGLTAVTFRANALMGGAPRATHMTNVAIHLLVGLSVFVLALRWLPAPSAVFVSAIVWLHPLQSEAVAYVAGRAELIAALGTVWVVWALTASPVTLSHAGMALMGLVVAMGGKDLGVMALPLAGLAWGWSRPLRWSWRLVAGVLAGLVAFLVISWPVLVSRVFGNAYLGMAERGGWGYLCLQSYALWHYLALVVWPVGLTIDHDFDVATKAPAIGAFVAGAGAVGLILLCRRRLPTVTLGLAWVIVALLPRFFVRQPELLTEHHMATPMIGIALALAATVQTMEAWLMGRRKTKEPLCVESV